jgi:glycine cleavage system H protein
MFRRPMSAPATSFYKRSNFVTHLPVDCLYSPSHFWIARTDGSRLRVGFTKFATRMLGEIVEVRFEKNAGDAVAGGDIVGSIEGFKAISDIYSCARGTFTGSNPALAASVELVGKDPYAAGWLYEVDGEPDDKCVPLDQYRALLDTTIDKILEKQKADEAP